MDIGCGMKTVFRILFCTFLGAVFDVCALGSSSDPLAEPSYLPKDANFVYVSKPPYNAVGDGRTDNTEAIRRAVSENLEKNRTLYFPKGIYMISGGIEWKNKAGIFWSRTSWRGNGRGKTVIKAFDNTPAFSNPDKPCAMIKTGSNNTTNGKGDAAHDIYIYDMTIDCGRGNAGAIGVDYNASNNGAMYRVDIRSGDGSGAVGLSMTRDVGPALIYDVSVTGFDIGIKTGGGFGLTMEKIKVEGQNDAGVQVSANCVGIRNLTSVNKVPALRGGPYWSLAAVVDSNFSGVGAESPAIIPQGTRFFLRNIDVSGYSASIDVPGKMELPSGHIDEYVSHKGVKTLFETAPKSLDIKVPELPAIQESPEDEWVSVAEFGAKADDIFDAGEAVQKAIDSGATTVYFPQGGYSWADPVILRGKVRRVMGFNSQIRGKLIVRGTEGPVIIERFRGLHVENAEPSHPVVLVSHGGPVSITPDAKGWFAFDVVASFKIGKGQFLYGRHINPESGSGPQITNDGGTVWILGFKSERFPVNFVGTCGSSTKVLAGLMRCSQGVKPRNSPSAVNDNSYMSLSLSETAFRDIESYDVVVKETHGGDVRLWEEPGRGQYMFPLYVGRPMSDAGKKGSAGTGYGE